MREFVGLLYLLRQATSGTFWFTRKNFRAIEQVEPISWDQPLALWPT